MSAPDINWKPLFDTAIQEHGAVKVAAALGYRNHTLVSRIAKEHVPASPKFQARIIATYHTVVCPHTGKSQARQQCRIWLMEAPTHNPGSLAQWRACQRCPHKPEA
ncbi:MAG: putative LacI family transcriptional regulator [Rhodocyclales bacterium]|nr:putative LacI family transcriptional regulator [Rhodocyclales bacterium]